MTNSHAEVEPGAASSPPVGPGPFSQRPTSPRYGRLVREVFPIAKHDPGEPLPPEDGRRVRAMRQVTQDRLRSCGLHCVADEAILIVSELVTNAILHGGGQQVCLTLDLEGDLLRIRVHDGVASHRGTVRRPGDEEEHGRGLALIQELARQKRGAWGVDDDGATTWCDLRLAADDLSASSSTRSG
ncbi:ATP-binding protein [Streptomyces sp. NPDC048182]|uniref:ATP-binding protein n=1 Tax=Streptomyces sp. NPDC048182 TaxID=3365507 RepID=UPI00371F9FD4